MDYQTFLTQVKEYFSNSFPSNCQIKIRQITKNNNLQLDALCILESGQNIAPTIYLNSFYDAMESGELTFTEVVTEITQVHRSHLPENTINSNFFTDFNNVRPHIIFKLIHYQKNHDTLSQIPHIPYLDLAICFCCLYDTPAKQHATITIRNEHLKLWDISCEELYEIAVANTKLLLPYVISDMDTFLQQLSKSPLPPLFHPSPMHILTNKETLFGASCLLYENVLRDFSLKYNSSFYILPSSIHEVILIPTDTNEQLATMSSMVRSVNAESVPLEEVLSDHAYFYDIRSHKITY